MKLEKKTPGAFKLHHKKRRLCIIEQKQVVMKQDHDAGIVRLCFGSKKLFRAQFDLEANDYGSLDEWRDDWRKERASEFFVIGSSDETAGCQGCVATPQDDGSLSLRLRLPDVIGKHLLIENVRFAYGHETILDALQTSRKIDSETKAGKSIRRLTGTAISYRFKRDDKGWRVFVSTESTASAVVSNATLGSIGVDVNAGHLAVSEIDSSGNPVNTFNIPCNTYGKSTDQAKAIIGNAVKLITEMAVKTSKPAVIEKLDFTKKRAELDQERPGYSRMISSFFCSKLTAMIHASCFRSGIEVIEINPAYTSVIGAVNYAQQYGISVHQGAATAIARRGLGFSERPAVDQVSMVTNPEGIYRRGGHAA